MKRTISILLSAALALFSGAACAVEISTDILPSCYRYPIVGANIIYANAPVPVYDSPSLSGTVVGYVSPDQAVLADQVDFDAGMVYILYYDINTQTNRDFTASSPQGWVEARFTTFYTDIYYRWVVTTDTPGNRLNLRSGPSGSSPSLGKYYAGTIVRQQEEPRNGYMKVKIGHIIGYMATDYLAYGLYTPSAELPELRVTAAQGAAIHKLPEAGSEVVKTAPQDAVVTVLSVRDDPWVQIVYEGETGYTRGTTLSETLSY